MIEKTTEVVVATMVGGGKQAWKGRIIRVGIACGAVLVAIEGPPSVYAHWLALGMAAFGGLFTPAEKASATKQ